MGNPVPLQEGVGESHAVHDRHGQTKTGARRVRPLRLWLRCGSVPQHPHVTGPRKPGAQSWGTDPIHRRHASQPVSLSQTASAARRPTLSRNRHRRPWDAPPRANAQYPIPAMAAPFVRDQWSLGILVDVSIEYLALPSTQAQPALEAGADRQPRRLRGAGLGVCSAPLVLPGAAWRPGACFCAAPILRRNYGVAPPNARLGQQCR